MNGIQDTDQMFSDADDDTEEVVNVSGFPAKFTVDSTTVVLKPNERCRIHKNYTRRQKMAKDRDPVASAIENMTGKRVLPVSHPDAPKPIMASTQSISNSMKG